MDYNIRIRVIVDMLRNHDKVKEVKGNPVVLQWLSDTSDSPDPNGFAKLDERSLQNENQNESGSEVSGLSDKNPGDLSLYRLMALYKYKGSGFLNALQRQYDDDEHLSPKNQGHTNVHRLYNDIWCCESL